MSVKTYTVYDAELIEVNGNEEFVRGIESEANHTRVVLYTDYASLLERCEKMEKALWNAIEARTNLRTIMQTNGHYTPGNPAFQQLDALWVAFEQMKQALASKEL